MPLIRAVVGGAEYGFAPLKLKELKAIRQFKEQDGDPFERLDRWKPFIESSMQRAGSQMPDVDDMDVDTAGVVFGALIRHVMKASGVELTQPGEGQPAAANA